jgi:hypothetical protein
MTVAERAAEWLSMIVGFLVEFFLVAIVGQEGGLHEWN